MMQFSDIDEMMIAQIIHDMMEERVIARHQAASLAYRLATRLQLPDPDRFVDITLGRESA